MYNKKTPICKVVYVCKMFGVFFVYTTFPPKLNTTLTHVIYVCSNISLSKGHRGSGGTRRRKFSFLMKKRRVIKHIS